MGFFGIANYYTSRRNLLSLYLFSLNSWSRSVVTPSIFQLETEESSQTHEGRFAAASDSTGSRLFYSIVPRRWLFKTRVRRFNATSPRMEFHSPFLLPLLLTDRLSARNCLISTHLSTLEARSYFTLSNYLSLSPSPSRRHCCTLLGSFHFLFPVVRPISRFHFVNINFDR